MKKQTTLYSLASLFVLLTVSPAFAYDQVKPEHIQANCVDDAARIAVAGHINGYAGNSQLGKHLTAADLSAGVRIVDGPKFMQVSEQGRTIYYFDVKVAHGSSVGSYGVVFTNPSWQVNSTTGARYLLCGSVEDKFASAAVFLTGPAN